MRLLYHFLCGRAVAAAFLLACMSASPAVSGDSIPPRILMDTGLEGIEPGVISATVHDDTNVDRVRLYYRKPGDGYYNSIEMKSRQDVYYRELTREFGIEGPVEYYILAQDTSGNQQTSPLLDPEENPLRSGLGAAVDESAPEVHLTNPEPGALLDKGDETIMISFYPTERQIDYNTLRLKVDRRDRTREADFIGNLLIWEPRRPLSDGYHEIELILRDTEGEYLGPNIWTFQVKSKRELPLGAEGDFYLGIQQDDRSGDDHGVPLWNNKLDLAVRGQSGSVNWRAGMMLSSEETTFLTSESLPDRQPINRYFLEGRTRHVRLRLGDTNPNFSELSLNGIRVRGVSLRFRSNRFNAEILRGINKREIGEKVNILFADVTPGTGSTYYDKDGEEKTLSPYQEIIQDPVTGKFNVYGFTPGTFQRTVTGLTMNTSPLRNRRANWKIGLNFFSAEDDTTSLNYIYDLDQDLRTYTYRDSTFITDYAPMKNWVGTIATSLSFNKNRSVISAEFGGTLATENMFGTVTEDIEDELPDNIDKDLFPINASTQTSFDKKKLKDSIGKGLADAMLSVYKFKLTTPVPIPKTSTHFKSELYRIPTHYVSLGNPQQKTDIGGIKLNVRSRVWRDQLTFNLGYDTYSNNLENERKQYAATDSTGLGTETKSLTKDTSVRSFSINYRTKALPAYAPFINVGYRNYNAENNLDATIEANNRRDKIDTATNTYTVSVGATLPINYQKHHGTLSFTNLSIDDNRDLDPWLLHESTNRTIMYTMNSAFHPLPFILNVSVGRTVNSSYRPNDAGDGRLGMDTNINLLTLAGTYKWFRDKRLGTTVGLGYIGSANDEPTPYKIDNTKTTIRFEANYRVTSIATVGGLVKYIQYEDSMTDARDYTEPIIGVNLRSAF